MGSVADRKRSGRASIVKTKVADVETILQRGPLKRPSVYINIIAEFIFLLKGMKVTLGCSKTAQRVIHHDTVWVLTDFFDNCTISTPFTGIVKSGFFSLVISEKCHLQE
ncbi:DUF4817 domain-containing protein [Trichonephila clavipes]|nr:DUF4817 domain-containing protein [Trichonephila clavipes]